MAKLLKIIIGLILVVIVVLVGVLLTTDINQYKPEIIQLVKEKTGRNFTIDGDLRLAVSLFPTVAVDGVTLGNADWGSEPEMLSVNRFEAEIALLPLLKKNIQVNRLILIEPHIYLETDKQGQGNWVFAAAGSKSAKPETSPQAGLPDLNINEVSIKQASLTYKDGKTGKTTHLLVESITAESSSFSDPLNLKVLATLNDSPVSVDATLGPLNDLTGNKPYPVNLSAIIDKATASIDGKIEKPMEGKGLNLDVSFNVDRLSQLSKVAGSDLPDAGPIKIGGKLADSKTGYSISALTAQLLQFEIKGDISISMAGERPSVMANLTSESVDISPFQSDEKKEKKEKMFSSDPLPLEGLNSADVDLKFKTNRLITRSVTLDNVDLTLKLNNGKLQIAPLTARTAGGDINISLELDASNGKSATLKNAIQIKQLELGQLPQLKKKELLTGGKTDVNIHLAGVGSSVSQIAASMNGDILVKTGGGKISNTTVDLAGADVIFSALNMMNPMAEKEKHTTLECAVIKFGVKDGLATTDRGIALQTQRMNIVGSGTIDLKTENLNLAIKPQAREGLGINLGALVDAVQITGTLVEPSAGIGTKGALTAGLAAGAAVATGGLSVLAKGLFDKSTADENPCDTALGKAPVKKAEQEKKPEEKSAVESTVDTAKDTVKDVTEGAGKLLKGLFD